MANFSFLERTKEYALFAPAAIDAERIYSSAPALCAVGCRKALELAVRWIYAADNTMRMPYRDNLQSLIHEPSFRFAVERQTWAKLLFIIKLGNQAVHTGQEVQKEEALVSLKSLFEFVEWIDYCYGSDYEERHFDEGQISWEISSKQREAERQLIREQQEAYGRQLREQQSLLGEKSAEIEALRRQVEQLSAIFTAQREQHRAERVFVPEDLSEFETRKLYIDVDLKDAGWRFTGPEADVREEYPVEDMNDVPGQRGYCDYVLFGRDGSPLAVIEAKRSSRDPNDGRQQALLYANALERRFGRRPMIFLTNGFETYFWDTESGPQRQVSGVFGREDLQKLMNRREERGDLMTIPISDAITNRYYQKEAIRAVCEQLEKGFRRHLLVMATGTGKTRTACSLTDVLSRGGCVTNILFLADRKALVGQARDAFRQHLPDMSLCNLCDNKDDRSARIVFSTYPTMLNAIDDIRTRDGQRLYTPAHFDLIIIDECHRSIFNKYRAIFEYFDAVLVGLTATPKMEVDRNTYDFFRMEQGIPTYAYDYETAVQQDHVLVPYYNYEVKLKFLEEGISYADLSEEDRERYEEDFAEDGLVPEVIPSAEMNRHIFNELTVDTVLQDLMERGIHTAGGDRLGKTIIFAQNKRHAQFILDRFDALYPRYRGIFARRVLCDDAYSQTVIDSFKQPDKPPFIAVSVDMMDTGIDVPECVNLVFFKPVRSKTKFWQMIGRGTRLCEGLDCVDQVDGEYVDKRRFLIFDYCGNFEFFREHKEGFEGHETKTLSERIFGRQIELLARLQKSPWAGEDWQSWKESLVSSCSHRVAELNPELISVKLKRQYVEKYKAPDAFADLTDEDRTELIQQLAPLVHYEDEELAKRFDNFMYGLILDAMEDKPGLAAARRTLCTMASGLERKASLPQIQEKLPLLREVQGTAFWEARDLLRFEEARRELRELIKFLDESGHRDPIITRLNDPVLERREGEQLEAAYDFEDYRARVNRYILEHGDTLAIRKLTHNIPLTEADYRELERVLTSELGTREDYAREFGDTPLGLLVRHIAKLDHEAAMEAFSAFINDESLNQRQIAFVHKVIHYIEQNGYMDNVSVLRRAPFDKPVSFIRLFDPKRQAELMQAIQDVKKNAETLAG